jgi:hypothetical protein
MYVTCPDPECQAPAEILDRFRLRSTGGPVEHVRTYCVRRHVFALPSDRVPGANGELDLVQSLRLGRDPRIFTDPC